MDEPLSNLDAALRISMRSEIKQLHQSMQTTFVYVTHDQAEALTLADRIVVMKSGVVQQIGTPDAIYERPSNKFVASFLGNPSINFLDGQLQQDGAGLKFRKGSLTLNLSPAAVERLGSENAGRAVSLGLRAEDVMPVGADEAASDCLQGRVLTILPVGSDQFLEIDVEGQRMFLRVGKEGHYQMGENVRLKVNLNRLHVFDQQDGRNLVFNA